MAQPPPVPLPARLRALAARGPRSLAQTLASVVDDWRLDLSLGVETREKVELGHIGPVLGAHADHGRAYHPTRARHLRRLFDALDLPPGIGLLDYGSGKGLVLFVAAERPFARLTGVEYAHALHAAAEFIPFIVLLFSLYVISGGILISGDIPGSPRINTAILALGALAANLLGTTGASMLLIRPLLRANGKRKHRVHVVIFFIFIVSNIGGLLLPIGDPPLFLGYLRGVPFNWTLTLFPEWLIANLLLLTVFFATDRYLARKEGAAPEQSDVPDPVIRIAGAQNVLWLAGVVLAAAFMVPGKQFFRTGLTIPEGGREGIMLMCAAASLILTPRAVRKENHFAFGPIIEVAALFGGLFLAMQPALELLIDRGGQLGVQTPAHFFWATGLLSSFLDNAPTYLVFADVARTVTPQDITNGINYSGAVIDPALLGGVSCGAVFMGANTYIGNGPNLMVAAIAREDGVPMPTFFGYMLWSGAILMPIFVLITFVMF